ncbi:hypothetical protein PCE1_003271 [Barthelona sp. PCE]
MFGVNLHELERNSDGVPIIVVKLVARLIKPDIISTRGLFRESANKSQIEMFVRRVNMKKSALDVDFNSFVVSPHELAGMLRYFFLCLPEPLIPYAVYDDFIEILSISNTEKRVQFLQVLLSSLPPNNAATLEFITDYFTELSSYSQTNMMTIEQISKCISDWFLRSESESGGYMHAMLGGQLVKDLLMFDNMFVSVNNQQPENNEVAYMLPETNVAMADEISAPISSPPGVFETGKKATIPTSPTDPVIESPVTPVKTTFHDISPSKLVSPGFKRKKELIIPLMDDVFRSFLDGSQPKLMVHHDNDIDVVAETIDNAVSMRESRLKEEYIKKLKDKKRVPTINITPTKKREVPTEVMPNTARQARKVDSKNQWVSISGDVMQRYDMKMVGTTLLSLKKEIHSFENQYYLEHNERPTGTARDPIRAKVAEYFNLQKIHRNVAAVFIQKAWRGYIDRKKLYDDGSLPLSTQSQTNTVEDINMRLSNFMSSHDIVDDVTKMTKEQVTEAKNFLKGELRKFDETIERQYGRKATRQDKEPLRPLYQKYKLWSKVINGQNPYVIQQNQLSKREILIKEIAQLEEKLSLKKAELEALDQ